jgi:hypothetical protein
MLAGLIGLCSTNALANESFQIKKVKYRGQFTTLLIETDVALRLNCTAYDADNYPLHTATMDITPSSGKIVLYTGAQTGNVVSAKCQNAQA